MIVHKPCGVCAVGVICGAYCRQVCHARSWAAHPEMYNQRLALFYQKSKCVLYGIILKTAEYVSHIIHALYPAVCRKTEFSRSAEFSFYK